MTTPLWLHSSSWWTQDKRFVDENYVAATQQRQADRLEIAVRETKNRFPACGGFLVWMRHDSFPCIANTWVIGFERKFKPAGLALKKVFRS